MALAALAAAVAACSGPGAPAARAAGAVTKEPGLPPGLIPPGPGIPVGVYERGFPGQAALLGSFGAASGVKPRLAVYYSGWGQRFSAGFAGATRASGAVPVVQLEPVNVPLAAITVGRWDTYLRAYARAVKDYRHPVILSFGHEMNGDWYSWGSGHEAPEAFVAAWRHVVSVFRGEGAGNARWMWTITAVNAPGSEIAQWWPGDGWADLVGVDGYYYYATDSFSSVFGRALSEIGGFTRTPVVIAEVGIGPNSHRVSQISGLFTGALAHHIGAIIWFDVTQNDGVYHQDWRLEGDQEALAALRTAAAAS